MGCGITGGGFPGNPAEDKNFKPRVSAKTVPSMNSSGGFSGGKQSRHGSGAVRSDADSAERGMSAGFYFEPQRPEVR